MSTLLQNLSSISKLVLLISYIWLCWISLHRLQEKKSDIASSLAKGITFFTIAIFCQLTGILFEINEIPVNMYQFAGYFMIISVFYTYRFSNQLNRSSAQPMINERTAIILAIGIILFGIIKSVASFQPITEIGTFFYMLEIYVMVYSVIFISPLIQIAVQDQTKIKYENPATYKRIQDMKWVGVLWILVNLFLCIENVMKAYSIADQGVWILSIFYGGSLMALVNSAFYRRENISPNGKPVLIVGYSPYLKNIK